MNKTELVAAVAEQAGLSKKDAEAAVKAFTDVVAEALKAGDKIQLVGFGTFEVSERAAREGRNPRTGETMTIANEACDAGRVLVNDRPAKASVNVKAGDIIEIQFGTSSVKVEVLDVQETVRKDDAKELYRYL